MISFNDQLGVATLQGRWKLVSPHRFHLTTSTLNSVHVLCGKPERKCTETIAVVYSKALDAEINSLQDGLLETITHEYKVVEWSADRIVAVEEMPLALLEIRIFPQMNTADRIRTERENPQVYSQYVLE